jgi:hypothetical protein
MKDLKKLLEEAWDNQGACSSCGWHSAFYEVEDSLSRCKERDDDNEICFETICLNDSSHKSCRIYILKELVEENIMEYNNYGK